jgi:predicted neutral ceramidase superfamily lipid hydrolase
MKVVVAILLIAAMFVVSARAQNRSTGGIKSVEWFSPTYTELAARLERNIVISNFFTALSDTPC